MAHRFLYILSSLRVLRGFITVPGLISLWGMALAFFTLWLDQIIHLNGDRAFLTWMTVSPVAARLILSTVAGSSMAALSLVYSTVLVVFTLAAGNVAPRLLQRFSVDRVSQVAVGMLGATFLYSLIVMHALSGEVVPEISMTVAMVFAVSSVLMLLVFVNQAAKRVTVDEEIAAIARQLDGEISETIDRGGSLARENLVRPDGPGFVLTAAQSGYVDRIKFEELTGKAAKVHAFVDFAAMPGDYVMRGHRLAHIVGPESEWLKDVVRHSVLLGASRTPTGDLRFSINLLVEIALRALSPGVNDTFTAIACVDRLGSSLMPLRECGVAAGVYYDKSGAARVTVPTQEAGKLVTAAFDPLRRAASGNLLMIEHLVIALGRLGRGEEQFGEDEIRRQLDLIAKRIERSDLLDEDREMISSMIEAALAEVGQPMASNAVAGAKIQA